MYIYALIGSQSYKVYDQLCICNRFNILHTVASAANQEPGQEAGLKVVQQLLTESLPVLHDLLQPQSRSLVLPVAQVLLVVLMHVNASHQCCFELQQLLW